MSNYDNFVFYGSWRETLEGFAEDFGKEYAQEALWNLMLSGTAGDMETTKKSIISWVNGSCNRRRVHYCITLRRVLYDSKFNSVF